MKREFFHLNLYFCIRKSYPNKQSDAGHGNWNGCQLITRKQGNSSKALDFKDIYSLYRFTEKSPFFHLRPIKKDTKGGLHLHNCNNLRPKSPHGRASGCSWYVQLPAAHGSGGHHPDSDEYFPKGGYDKESWK